MRPASVDGDWDVARVYDELTDGRRRCLRVSELVYTAAERFPGLVPTRASIDAERQLLQKEKAGLEIDQGAFVSRVLDDHTAGLHLLHSMSLPTAAALERREELARSGSVDLGPVRVDRDGDIGYVTIQNHAVLNAEDDRSAAALETAVDLVLLDDAIAVGVLRGGLATHPKHAGRRILGSGINLTSLYHGKISLIEFMVERELGALSKMYRGQYIADGRAGDLERQQEKPWIAAMESFAIGGACQWLLVMDHVIAEDGSYCNLPANKEGIVPGCAGLRLPRFVGDRLARQAVFFGRTFQADSPEGRLIVDEVVPGSDVGNAVERAATVLTSVGATALVANRRTMRAAEEPLDQFRRYMSVYAREQARCLYSPGLIANLERNWDAAHRSPSPSG
ncbi:MAG: enoyl-CoA hydratase/isomerase family protein [Acidimicrobiales bacterium]